jgi:hypothetical protein
MAPSAGHVAQRHGAKLLKGIPILFEAGMKYFSTRRRSRQWLIHISSM